MSLSQLFNLIKEFNMSRALLLGLMLASMSARAQQADSLSEVSLDEVIVVSSLRQKKADMSPQVIELVSSGDLIRSFSGNLMKSLEYIPGVQSMSIGSGFSKPMIRGVGFNRVSVTENGVKQEGQQWGADHGLEIDAFNVEQVNIRKGPSSLLLGSDAMGGVIEILPPLVPVSDQMYGSIDLLGRSVNGLLGGSLMLGMKCGAWFVKARYSEQHYADYAVPTDTIVYLTQKIPITDRHLNNTAGFDRSASLYSSYTKNQLSIALAVSNAYQKVGFFAAAHGVPDPSKVEDDGNRRDIDLPYSFVNHFKATLNTRYWWGEGYSLTWDLGYQNNHREEWSAFHTHYPTQPMPEEDPDRELAFMLNTFSSGLNFNMTHSEVIKSTISWDLQHQDNDIAGYSFLLPAYKRWTTGLAWVLNYSPNEKFHFSGGVRYDLASLKSEQYEDKYLAEYLEGKDYSSDVIEKNMVRSHKVDRNFGDYSLGVGMVWNINHSNTFRANIGRSYRLPGVNELASNGVHHSSFMHEQGDSDLDSEQGWQLDMAYYFRGDRIDLSFAPFVSWYQNYIYLRPTGEWSILPHAGLIYRYSQSQAFFVGAELSLGVELPYNLKYNLSAEYIHSYNIDEWIPLSFSPPASMRNRLVWEKGGINLYAELHSVAAQNRVARNEETTPSAHLFNLGASIDLPFISKGAIATLRADNILNKKYLNHLSFYRKVEIPEPGRNIQLSIKIPFKL